MMQHRHAEEFLWGAVEIIPNRLYYAPLKFFPNQDDDHNDVDSEEESRNNNTSNNINTSSTSSTTQTSTSTSTTSNSNSNNNNNKTNTKKEIHYFSIDNDLIYWNFFLDFGPLNLGQLYRFCSTLNAKLSDPKLSNSIICFYSGGNSGQYRANASVLMCAWEMLYLGRTLEESYWGWRNEQEELEEVQEVQEVSRQFGGKGGGPPSSNVSMPPELRSAVMRQSHKAAAATAAAATSNTPSSSSSSSNTPSNNDGINSINNNSNTTTSPFAKLHPLPPFHDASPILCTYDLSVYDCLSGLDKARRHGFFKFGNAHPVVFHKAPMIVHNDNNNNNIINNNNDDVNDNHDNGTNSNNTSTSISHTGPNTFNIQEYEYFEQVEKGDLNWIIQNKIIAFAGPHAQKVITPEGFCMLTPRDYIPYFLKSNVKLVIRLNKKCYDEREFTKVGIKHVDHYYLDGSCPEMSILLAVVKDMESIAPDEAFAIHCKAGLGRTGTCIGAYMMKHFRMTAREVIGWMRICRPGMVIGPQQHFLQDIESVMWQEGEVYRSNVKGNNRWVLPWVMVDNDEGKMQEQEKEKEKDGAVVAAAAATPATSSIMATPGKHTSGHGVFIVTPDHHHSLVHHAHVRQEVKTPAARKLDTQYDVSMTATTSATASIPASPTASASMSAALSSNSSPLPTIDTLNVQEMEREQHHHQQHQQQQQQQQPQEACPMNVEESQAHGLLSRRLDQFQVRHGQQQQQQQQQQNASQQNSR